MTGKSLQLSKYGTAATADKQTSPTDTTAGALMAVGAFGVGSENFPSSLVLGTDEDLLAKRPTGYYRYGNSAVNIPSANSGNLTVITRNSNTITLYATDDSGRTFVRHRSGLEWSLPWQELYHTGNILGTVGQGTASGNPVTGTVTGAIIERGSNGNGEYVKFADGTLYCFVKGRSKGTGFLVAESSSVGWLFPEPFIDDSYSVVLTNDTTSLRALHVAGSSSSHYTKDQVRIYNDNTSGVTYFNAIAIGRWY